MVAPSFDAITSNIRQSGKTVRSQQILNGVPAGGLAATRKGIRLTLSLRHGGEPCSAIRHRRSAAQLHGDWLRFGQQSLPGIKKLLYRMSR